MPVIRVNAAPRGTYPHGLFSAVTFASNPEALRGGIDLETLPCGPAKVNAGPWCPEPSEATDYMQAQEVKGSEEFYPFQVFATYQCSPIGTTQEFMQRQAENALVNGEQWAAEAHLWASFDRLETITVEPAGETLGELEMHIASTLGVGVLHMSRLHATTMLQTKLLEVKGNRLQTLLGTPVVAGGGYGNDKIVVTSPLVGYRSEISDGMPAYLFDHSNNDAYAVATRHYVIGYEHCGAASVEL